MNNSRARPESSLEPWQWPEEHWRKLVARVRAGRPLHPASWPGGARCAVALSFDSDHETNELRDGGKSIGRLAWGQYGNRVGVPRILKLLERHAVKATFYVPAVTALLHPDEQRRVVAEGHEVGIPGWIHERNAVLPLEAERDLQMRAADTLEKITGVRPVGIPVQFETDALIGIRTDVSSGLVVDVLRRANRVTARGSERTGNGGEGNSQSESNLGKHDRCLL